MAAGLSNPLKRPIDVVCIGETMLALAPSDRESLTATTQLSVGVAGGESNVACYLADLGHRVHWYSRLGNDPFGDRILSYLNGVGVRTDQVQRSDAPTGLMFKDPGENTAVYYRRKGSAAAQLDPGDVHRLRLDEAAIVHLTGVTAALSETAKAMCKALLAESARRGARTSFDVNYRPALWANPAEAATELLSLAQSADIIFIGRDESQELWGTGDASSIRDLIGTGPTVVVKDGGIGATEFGGNDSTGEFIATPPVSIIEAVGAGDAFAAGFLSGLLNGFDSHERLRLGHRLAALALSSTQDHVSARELRIRKEG